MSFLKTVSAVAAGTALIAAAGASYAGGNLTPGTAIVPTDAGSVLSTPLASEFIPFASPTGSKNPYSGTLASFVEDEGAANPLGGLTFLYGVTSDFTSTVPLGQLAANGFASFDTSAYYSLPGGGDVLPSSAHRTLDGDTIKFSFLDADGNEALLPGEFSYLMVVRTNAHSYTNILNGITDGTESNALSYAPAAVPEASTTASLALLLVLGLGSVTVASRKKANAQAA